MERRMKHKVTKISKYKYEYMGLEWKVVAGFQRGFNFINKYGLYANKETNKTLTKEHKKSLRLAELEETKKYFEREEEKCAHVVAQF